MSFSKKPDLASANRLTSQSQPMAAQQQQHSITPQSQSHSQSSQQKQQSQPIYPWSAHTLPFKQSPSPFLRNSHALSTTATAVGELFLFGGYVHSSRFASNDLYVISTQDFSTTLLQTSGDVPSPRYAHGTVFTSTILLIWGGMAGTGDQNAHDDSFYLFNLGTSDLLMSRPAQADQSFLRSSIARVDPHRGRWSRARRSFLPFHDVSGFQALRLRWPDRQEAFR
jgi:hypothetical protein